MLSFLIGLVLIFSIFRNDCEGSKLKELIQLYKVQAVRQLAPTLPGGGPPKICSSAAQCSPGSGCLLQGGAGSQQFGICMDCSLVGSIGIPGIVVDGCPTSGGPVTVTPGPGPNTKPSGTGKPTPKPTRNPNPNPNPNPGTNPLDYLCKQASECKGKFGSDWGCAKLTIKLDGYPDQTVQGCIPCNMTAGAISNYDATIDGCSEGLSTLAIVGIAIGATLLVGAMIALTLCCLISSCPLYKWRTNRNNEKYQNGPGAGWTNSPAQPQPQTYPYQAPANNENPNPTRGSAGGSIGAASSASETSLKT